MQKWVIFHQSTIFSRTGTVTKEESLTHGSLTSYLVTESGWILSEKLEKSTRQKRSFSMTKFHSNSCLSRLRLLAPFHRFKQAPSLSTVSMKKSGNWEWITTPNSRLCARSFQCREMSPTTQQRPSTNCSLARWLWIRMHSTEHSVLWKLELLRI